MQKSEIIYFDRTGPENTRATLQAAKERALKLKPEAVIMASSSGKTALEAAQIFSGADIRLIAVSFQKHLWGKYSPPEKKLVDKCRDLGVEFLPDEPVIPMLSADHPDIVNAWRTVGQGFKVALQVASMCVDTNLVKSGSLVISMGGSSRGADTAVAVKIQGYDNVLKSIVTEIIAMPSR